MSIIDDMVAGFLECAAWADFEAHGVDEGSQFSEEAKKTAKKVCSRFLSNARREDLDAYQEQYDSTRMGNRVYLDSVGHGTGFWDEDNLPEGVGERLSAACGSAHVNMWQDATTGMVNIEI